MPSFGDHYGKLNIAPYLMAGGIYAGSALAGAGAGAGAPVAGAAAGAAAGPSLMSSIGAGAAAVGSGLLNNAGVIGSQLYGSHLSSEDNRRNIEFQRETNRENFAYQDKVNEQNQRFQNRVNMQNQQLQMDVNRSNQAYQDRVNAQMREWALQDWQSVNRYNHPKAQMARYAEAGLNPNLIYGQSNMTSPVTITKAGTIPGQAARGHGIHGQATTATAPRSERRWMFDPSVLFDIAQKKANTLNMMAQNQNLHEQNVLLRQQAGAAHAEARYKLAKTKALEYGAFAKYGTRAAEFGERVVKGGADLAKKVYNKGVQFAQSAADKFKATQKGKNFMERLPLVIPTMKSVAGKIVNTASAAQDAILSAPKVIKKTGGSIWSKVKSWYKKNVRFNPN